MVSPLRPTSLALLHRCTEILAISAPSCPCSGDEFSTLHHGLYLGFASAFAVFALGTYIAFARAQDYLDALLFAETQLLTAHVQSSCWCPAAFLDLGTTRVLISPHHHLIISMIPSPESQILRSDISFLPTPLQALIVPCETDVTIFIPALLFSCFQKLSNQQQKLSLSSSIFVIPESLSDSCLGFQFFLP